jgi:NAD-dependent deacetylase
MTEFASLQQAADLLRAAQHVAVLTGAGVSQESGVPTFRDAAVGLWSQYDPAELATPSAFQRNPKLVWDWYAFRREQLKQAQPNPGHVALVRLAQRVPELTLITQNVDDLHERAGSQAVIHLHGSITRFRCFAACHGDKTQVDPDAIDFAADGPPPSPHCGARIRPDVVWFTEQLPRDALRDASAAAQDCDVMLVVGTSGLVIPAADLPAAAKLYGAKVIEINPDDTAISRLATVTLRGPSGMILPQLVALLDD